VADSARIEVEGYDRLRRELRKVSDDLPGELRAIAKQAAMEVATTARTLVPERSGDLKRSIRAGATARSGTVKAGKRTVPYAGPIHFGWLRRHIRPQPFMYRALDRRRDEVARAFAEQVEQLIADTFGR